MAASAAAAAGRWVRHMSTVKAAKDTVKAAANKEPLSKTSSGGFDLGTFLETSQFRIAFNLVPFVALVALITREGIDFYQEWSAIEQPRRR